MAECIAERVGTPAVSGAPPRASTTRQYPRGATGTSLEALNRALSDFQALVADPHFSWKGKKCDGEDCAALMKILAKYEACVGSAPSGTDLDKAAQRVADSVNWKAAQTAQLRHLSTMQCKKRDFPVLLARKLKIQHQVHHRSLFAATSAMGFVAAVVEALSALCQRATSALSSAREECEDLRRQLASFKNDAEAVSEKARRLCLEGHALRFGYGCSPQLTRAYDMYVEAARLGAAEGFTCAGYENTSSTLSEQQPMDGKQSRSVSPHSQPPASVFDQRQTSRELQNDAVPHRGQRSCTLESLRAPTLLYRINRARYFFEQAAQLGHSDALFRLGRMAETGRGGFTTDYSRAVSFYRQAVGYAYEQGNLYSKNYGEGSPTGLNNLASLYYRGCGCPVDFELAAALFKKAASVGNIHACYNLAICYEFGRGVVAEDSDRALKLYLQAAEAGHVKAAAALGMLLFKLNVAAAKPADAYTEAARWLQMAASKEDPEATFALGQLYETGLGATMTTEIYRCCVSCGITSTGVVRDPGQALACYRKALAGEPSPKVHLRLAHLLFSRQTGNTVASKKEAFKHYRVAAEEGNDPEAWNCLGLCHEEGLGSADGIPDYAEAAKCYENAVQYDCVDAMCNLARLLSKGLGVPASPERGFELLKRAACKGHLQAKLALENEGRIVPRPLLEVALGYAEVADKPLLPAVKPTSPVLDKDAQRDIPSAPLRSKGHTSDLQEALGATCEQAGEHRTKPGTLSPGNRSSATSSFSLNSSRSSSPNRPRCSPPSQTESAPPIRIAHASSSAFAAMLLKDSRRQGTTYANEEVGSAPSLRNRGSFRSVPSPATVAQKCEVAVTPAPHPSKTDEKITNPRKKHGSNCSQDASRSPHEPQPTFSPLSPGQIGCWPERSPSLTHQVTASSPSRELFYRTTIPRARNSLAHLLLVDRRPLPNPSTCVPVDESYPVHLCEKVADPMKTLAHSCPMYKNIY